MSSNNKKKKHPFKDSLLAAGGTFIVSIIIFIASEFLLRSVAFLLGLIFLLVIILVGILFDIIGTAVAAAEESALNAKAAKKVPGAREGVYLIKNADKVANFCNDVIGDICGTVSGAIGAALVFQVLASHPTWNDLFLSSVMGGLVAALTVGGKAYGKSFAIGNSTEIIFFTGKLLKRIKSFFGVNFFR